MEYRKWKDTYYIRIDKGEDAISELLFVCRKEGISSAIYSGIGACSRAELHHHTHAMFSFKKNGEHQVSAGHVKTMTVLYTAEIELRPVCGGTIGRKYDEETGTGFWKLT